MKRSVLIVCVLGLVMLVAASAVNANSSQSFSWTRALAGERINWSETIALPQYSGPIGSLSGIDIALETSIDCEIGLENLASGPSDLAVDLKVNSQVKQGATTLLSQDYAKAQSFSSIPAFDNDLNWGGTSGFKVQHFIQNATSAVHYSVAAADFASYVGGGNVNFDVSATSVHWIPTGSGGSMAAYYSAIVPAKVTITYDTVPEPGSLLALGSGLIGLVGLAIRRRK
ncbi:MAG: PEP-CTERM sorting domain-containing protein [Armatimonadetes bacterium]|nr:PEP-CTERM sorting domain-containing protein [Armatimonadota bacterium]